jgi:hypothetical protein
MSKVLELLTDFQAELSKTGVISDSFKEWLVSQFNDAIRVAYKQGHAEGVKEEREANRKRQP